MAQDLQPVRGTHDLLPDSYAQHQSVIHCAERVAQRYGYHRMDTPIFEFSEVFHRAVGETSDIVSKETYTFTDRGGESITLRPEFTAAIVRSLISNKLTQELPFKCFYAGPAFRYERPQKGRLRQFHQIGAELIGSNEPSADVEMITLAADMLRRLQLADVVTLELNSLGDAASRAAYREALVGYLTKYADRLSDDSRLRLERNPLRILDSKNEGDRDVIADAPVLHDYFNEVSLQHFARVKAGLEALGIAYTVNDRLVRGLDYYSHTVFEFTTDKLGAQGTVLAGGRYDGLVKLMGGPEIAGVGFAAGIERLVALREGIVTALLWPTTVSVIPMGEAEEMAAWQLVQELRENKIATDIAFKGNAKKRFERANKLQTQYAVVIGAEEMASGLLTIKNLRSGVQEKMTREQVLELLRDYVV